MSNVIHICFLFHLCVFIWTITQHSFIERAIDRERERERDGEGASWSANNGYFGRMHLPTRIKDHDREGHGQQCETGTSLMRYSRGALTSKQSSSLFTDTNTNTHTHTITQTHSLTITNCLLCVENCVRASWQERASKWMSERVSKCVSDPASK